MIMMTVAVKVNTKRMMMRMMIHGTAVKKVHSAPLQPNVSEKIFHITGIFFTITTWLTNNRQGAYTNYPIITPSLIN